ncbi:CCR4-NOT transcription complex subunit 4 isoform X4 [Oopsacas minuta]|uniref:CCR4-NOT transcription complex subunit 4 n=1 Tax=Oopsacas minuta TaxID=111878 RepID=A0AAV7KQ87_9METZ|nr:CCR4-NOT transcription complex subunit 4 isoform X4 [Oopsacas minuta]
MSKEQIEIDIHECPLCMEPFELDDLNFYPCACEYQICRFCWHRIKTDESGLCPACRQPYTENPAEYTPLTQEQITKLKQKKKTKSHEKKQKQIENRKNLSEVRVVQKNLVFVVGLSKRLAEAEVLKRPEYFGKFGKIQKIVINTNTVYHGPQGPSVSAYVTYQKTEDASKAIQSVNNAKVDGRILKVSFGTTKYCSNFLKGASCPKTDCMYLHELGEDEASFTKEDMAQGKHQLYETATLSQAVVIREVVYKEPPVRRTTPTQPPKLKEPPKITTPPISQSALPPSASWASKTTPSKDTNSPPKLSTYLPPSTQQPKGPLVLLAIDNESSNDTKNRQLTPDRARLSNSSPLRDESPNHQSPNSSYSEPQGVSPTRRNGEGDLDTLSPITPTHESITPSPDSTPLSQQSNQSSEVNNNKTNTNNDINDMFTEASSLATIQAERNVYPIRSFSTFGSSPALELGILGSAWGNSDPNDKSFTTSQTPLTADIKWEYLHSDVPLASDSQIPLHRSNQSNLSTHDPTLGLDLSTGQSTVSVEDESIKGITSTAVDHNTSSMLMSRRASLGNIQVDTSIVSYRQEPITHSLQNLGISDTPNRIRSATNVSPDIHIFQEHPHPNNLNNALDRRTSVDSSVKPNRAQFDTMDMYRPMYALTHPSHNMNSQPYINPSNHQQIVTPNSNQFPSPSNGRHGMELHNRNYDMLTNSNFTPLIQPHVHMNDWYKLPHDTWQNSGMPQSSATQHNRGDREEIFKAPGIEKQGLLGGGTHWSSVPSLSEPELTPPPGFGNTTNQLYSNRPMAQFPIETPKQQISPFPHSSPDQLYPRPNSYPTSTPMDQPYPYSHSNPYNMLPREQSYPIGQFMDCEQPLIYQPTTNNSDIIDPYEQTPATDFDLIYSNQVKNKPIFQQKIPNSSIGCHPRGQFIRKQINSIHNDPNVSTEKQFSDLNDISHQNTRYLSDY